MPQAPRIIEHPSKHWSSRGGSAILAIVGHGTGGSDSLDYLTENARKVSIPYLIARDGTIYHMVSDDRAANHAGAATSTLIVGGKTYKGGRVNQVTTGFELESLQEDKPSDYTEQQLLSMGWLINDMRRRLGALPLVRHGTLDPTRRSDPVGLSVSSMEKWAAKAALHFAPSDPLRAKELPGIGHAVYCSEATAAFYVGHGGLSFFGYPVSDERETVGEDEQPCTILPCERAVIKTKLTEPAHQALLKEIFSKGWA